MIASANGRRSALQASAFIAGLLATALPSTYAGVTRDANGWTQVTPSADSRVIYVSSSTGDDANDGLSEATAKATITGTNGGNSLMRSGFPDHMLLKRGDTWTTGGLGAWKSGRGPTEPIVISYYGTSGPRPVIKITNFFIDHNGAARNYIFLKGIEVYKSNSDPNSPDYTGVTCTNSVRFVGGGANIRIEDCRFRFLEVTVQSYTSSIFYTNFEFRRNIILDAWKENSFTYDLARIQGIFMSGVVGYEFEENFFDHNGWNEQIANAGANMFNHNAYIQYTNSEGGLFRGNIFARGAAHGLQARSAGIIDRNLFVLNAISFNIGGVDYPTDPDVQPYPNVALDNVVLNGRLMHPTNSNYPRTGALWGIWEDIYVTGAFVDGNIVANKANTGTNDQSYNGINHMDFGANISYNWTPSLDTSDASWPHPGADLGDYYASIGGTNSTTAYLDFLRNRGVGTLPWNMTAYAAINYIRAGFLQPAIDGVYAYPGGTPAVTIAATDATAAEPSGSGLFTVTASPAPTSPLTVNLSRGGSATNGSDYSSIATTVIVPTSGSVTIPVTVLNDQLVEGSETVTLTLASGTGYTIGAANSATVTISDNDTGVVADAGAGFQTTAITSQTGTFQATFYATPSVDLIDTPIGLSQISPTAFTDLAAIVLFANTGVIQARNGGAYGAASSIAYSGGTTYFFRLVINVPAKTYSAYVTPSGGTELTIGTNYAFRTEQSGATSLNYWSARTNTPTGASCNVSNFSSINLQPDVIVTSVSYSQGNFSCVVKNQGNAATPAGIDVAVAYYVDGTFRTWGAMATPPLAAGASVTIGTNGGAYHVPNGAHTLMAWVDDIDRFAESNESNNQLSQSITVSAPVYPAENAVLASGAFVETVNAGYNGTGYANFPTTGGTATFNNVYGGAGGTKTLVIRNALGGTTSRIGQLIVNGTTTNITFAPTGAFTTWTNKNVTVTLNAGTANTIVLKSTGQDLANVDEISVQ